jgi:hypothetical protein
MDFEELWYVRSTSALLKPRYIAEHRTAYIFYSGTLILVRHRRELSSPDRTLGSWVRIPRKAWMYVLGSSLAMG